jgi:hypothetical protein
VIYLELCALKLNNFDCSYNRIICLPLNLREMNSLIELNVDHNPLETPPASVRYLFNNNNKKRKIDDFILDLYSWFTSYNAFSSCRSNERRKTTRIINRIRN